MLAQNFMSAEELEIDGDVHAALIKVLGMLERGELIHYDIPDDGLSLLSVFGHYDKGVEPLLFNMNAWAQARGGNHTCGTVMCIGGTVEAIMKNNIDHFTDGLSLLFYPNTYAGDWKSITVSKAATAVRNYLTTGTPNWEEAVK